MDDNRKTGLRFVAFIMFTLAVTEFGWATQVDGSPLVGALTGLCLALLVTAILMGLATLDD